LNAPPYKPTSSPINMAAGVALHLLEHGLLDGFEKSDLRSVGRMN